MTELSGAARPHLIDEPVVAQALQVILVAILLFALAISVFTGILGWPLVPYLTLVIAAASLAALGLGRTGRIRLAMWLVLVIIIYAVLHAALGSGGLQNVGFTVIPVLIVVGGLLLGRLKVVLLTAAIVLSVVGMLLLRSFVLHVGHFNTGDLGDLFVFLLNCAAAAVVGGLLAVRIESGIRQVRASESHYRDIFENIQDVYFEMRIGGLLLEVSPAGSELFGIPREAMIGREFADFCADTSGRDSLLAALHAGGKVSNHELVVRNAGGTNRTVLVNASLYPGSEDGDRRVIGSLREITQRKIAEQALQESEARLRFALDATDAGTFDYYPQTGMLIWSETTKKHFGMSPNAEVTHDIFLSAVHPDDRERVRQTGEDVARPERDGILATEYRTVGVEDGKERWIAVRGRMQFDRDRRAVRLIGATLDITRRKHMEEDLRRRAEELQKIMDVAPVALFTAHDPECSHVTVNSTANALLEIPQGSNSPSAPGGPTPPSPFFRDGIQVPVRDLPLQTAARGVEVRDFEVEALLPSGTRKILWGHASPLRDANGRVRGAIAALQDVTGARQRAHAILRESEERFQNAADAAPVILWFSDTEKRLVFVNRQMTQFTGLPAGQVLGDGWTQLIHPDDLQAARATYYDGVDRRATYQVEYRARRADGEYRDMLGTSSPRYVGGEYAGQVGSVIDITDIKRRQTEDLDRQKWESLGTLAGGIAHDFNNLLGGILSQAELAQTELAEGASASAEIHAIRAVAIRGAEIVRQLMAYSGHDGTAVQLVNASRLVEESQELLKVIVSKQAVLQLELDAEVPTVRANPATLRQILVNLAGNASEAIGANPGVIRVRTTRTSISPHTLNAGSTLPAGEYLQLEVSDTGCGIPPHVRSRIFDPFFTTKSPGRGMGLSVVQGIVRSLGGNITVRSALGEGSTFQILLPGIAEPAVEARRTSPHTTDARKLYAGTILMVEDEDSLRLAICKLLRRSGLTVLEAAGGFEALDMLARHAAELTMVVLDVTLPEVASSEILRAARHLRPDLRVVVTSAYSEQQVAAMFSGLDIRPFLRKPYRLADILNLIG